MKLMLSGLFLLSIYGEEIPRYVSVAECNQYATRIDASTSDSQESLVDCA